MKRVVIDTNVLVSSLINKNGKPAGVIQQVYCGMVMPVVSRRMFAEYEGVLKRPKFRITAPEIKVILGHFSKLVFDMPDLKPADIDVPEDDAVFVAAARYGAADYLITGNTRHFIGLKNEKFRLVTPDEFLKLP